MAAADRVVASRGATRASVIVLHGYAAEGAVHEHDARAFVDERTEVVLPDAPGHGCRDDGRLARLAGLPDAQRRSGIHDIAREWARELPRIVADCRGRGAHAVGVVGISMGGYAAFAALAAPCPFACVAALLASPTLFDEESATGAMPPLLVGLAGRDQAVPPEPGRNFARRFGAELHEYPHSEHMMRGEDWRDLWARTAAFLQRNLRSH